MKQQSQRNHRDWLHELIYPYEPDISQHANWLGKQFGVTASEARKILNGTVRLNGVSKTVKTKYQIIADFASIEVSKVFELEEAWMKRNGA